MPAKTTILGQSTAVSAWLLAAIVPIIWLASAFVTRTNGDHHSLEELQKVVLSNTRVSEQAVALGTQNSLLIQTIISDTYTTPPALQEGP